MTTVKRKRYTTEFKQSAAKLVIVEGYTQKQAADSLGVSPSAIARWVITAREEQQNKESASSSTTCQSEEQMVQIKKLQLENEQLKQEKDVLKKAAVIFAKESG